MDGWDLLLGLWEAMLCQAGGRRCLVKRGQESHVFFFVFFLRTHKYVFHTAICKVEDALLARDQSRALEIQSRRELARVLEARKVAGGRPHETDLIFFPGFTIGTSFSPQPRQYFGRKDCKLKNDRRMKNADLGGMALSHGRASLEA